MNVKGLRDRLVAALIDLAKDTATGVVMIFALLLLLAVLIQGLALVFRIG